AELTPERIDADLILPEGRLPPPLAYVEAHQPAVDRLLRGIDGEQADGDLDGLINGAGPLASREEPREDADGKLSQTLPLRAQPLLEWLFVDVESLEQVAPVQPRRLGERSRRAPRRQPLDGARVHSDGAGWDHHASAFVPQARSVSHRPADRR